MSLAKLRAFIEILECENNYIRGLVMNILWIVKISLYFKSTKLLFIFSPEINGIFHLILKKVNLFQELYGIKMRKPSRACLKAVISDWKYLSILSMEKYIYINHLSITDNYLV